ncbi:hypothetical protein PIB30_114967, partial [Stylosanthes scabra]|nr:hypothetical protein [Stylosanthes scabra]
TRRTRLGRNDDREEASTCGSTFPIFIEVGSPLGAGSTYTLDDREKASAHLHVLLNCDQINPYLE